MSALQDWGSGTMKAGSKRDSAPQPLPGYNANLNAPANFWQGNQLQIPGAQGLTGGPTAGQPPGMPQPGQPPQGGIQGLLGMLGGGGGMPGGLAGMLGGMGQQGGQGAQPGSASSTLPMPQQGAGPSMNPGIARILQMLQQGQQ